MALKFNPITGQLDLVSEPFITNGADGVTTIRWQSSSGVIWDMVVNDAGSVVLTEVAPALGGTMIAAGSMFGLTYNA